MVTAPVAGANRVAQLGYQYDNYYVPAGATPAVATGPQTSTPLAALAARPLEVRAVSSNPLSLSDAPARTSLQLPAPPLSGVNALKFSAPVGPSNLYLVLSGIMLNSDPGDVVYHVYIDLPEGATPTPADPHYVGSVNFFHIRVGHDHGDSSDLGHHSTVAFNVTDAVRKLQGANGLAQQATVTLIPSGKPDAGAQPIVQQVQLLAK